MAKHDKICKLALLLLVICRPPLARCVPQSSAACEQSTVESLGNPEYASRAKAFLAELQRVIQIEDKQSFASLVHYPVRFVGAHSMKFTTPAEVIQRYPTIVTPGIRKAILDQSSSCLFANYQGVMIGRGEIWFDQQPDGKMKIITINATVSK